MAIAAVLGCIAGIPFGLYWVNNEVAYMVGRIFFVSYAVFWGGIAAVISSIVIYPLLKLFHLERSGYTFILIEDRRLSLSMLLTVALAAGPMINSFFQGGRANALSVRFVQLASYPDCPKIESVQKVLSIDGMTERTWVAQTNNAVYIFALGPFGANQARDFTRDSRSSGRIPRDSVVIDAADILRLGHDCNSLSSVEKALSLH